MFVLSSADELKGDLGGDLKRIAEDADRSENMLKNFNAKKDALTK